MMKGYISGATGFLGQILARHFIDTGVSLTISGRNKGELEDLRKNLLERAALDNASIGLHVLDFSKPDDFSKQFDEIDISSFDWCINAAGDQGKIESDLHLSLSDYQDNSLFWWREYKRAPLFLALFNFQNSTGAIC